MFTVSPCWEGLKSSLLGSLKHAVSCCQHTYPAFPWNVRYGSSCFTTSLNPLTILPLPLLYSLSSLDSGCFSPWSFILFSSQTPEGAVKQVSFFHPSLQCLPWHPSPTQKHQVLPETKAASCGRPNPPLTSWSLPAILVTLAYWCPKRRETCRHFCTFCSSACNTFFLCGDSYPRLQVVFQLSTS